MVEYYYYTATTSFHFLLLPITSSASCSCVDALNTPSSKLPLSSSVSLRLPLRTTCLTYSATCLTYSATPTPPPPHNHHHHQAASDQMKKLNSQANLSLTNRYVPIIDDVVATVFKNSGVEKAVFVYNPDVRWAPKTPP